MGKFGGLAGAIVALACSSTNVAAFMPSTVLTALSSSRACGSSPSSLPSVPCHFKKDSSSRSTTSSSSSSRSLTATSRRPSRLLNSFEVNLEDDDNYANVEFTEERGASGDWGIDLPSYKQRPDWAPEWVPTWAVTLHPLAQVAVTLVLYFFHMLVLSKAVVPFPVQLLPNTDGLFQSIGLDSLAGLFFLAAWGWFRKQQGKSLFPDVFNNKRRLPFCPPVGGRSSNMLGRLIFTILQLVTAYMSSGRASATVEDLLNLSSTNVALGRAVQVLAGHLVWVLSGVVILHLNVKPFFGRASRWMKSSLSTYWLWWTVGGYYVSSLAFHISDTVNQLLLPPSAFNVNSVVTQMINPENNDVTAMVVGSLAPCVSAPWWEEVLYRGFLLPALYLYFPPRVAAPFSAIVFAAHHMSLSGMIPLATLGLLWAVLYVLSGNLFVPIAIHCLWNSRVFLGSYWGA